MFSKDFSNDISKWFEKDVIIFLGSLTIWIAPNVFSRSVNLYNLTYQSDKLICDSKGSKEVTKELYKRIINPFYFCVLWLPIQTVPLSNRRHTQVNKQNDFNICFRISCPRFDESCQYMHSKTNPCPFIHKNETS